MSNVTGRNAKWPKTQDEFDKVLSEAVDEIYQLRTALANEARILEAHTEYKTFPKTRRQFAEESIGRMRAAARGDWKSLYDAYRFPKNELRASGADDCLTNQQWLEQSGFTI